MDFVELRGYKKNDPSVEGPLSVPFIVQYADRNLQVDCILRRKGTNIFLKYLIIIGDLYIFYFYARSVEYNIFNNLIWYSIKSFEDFSLHFFNTVS